MPSKQKLSVLLLPLPSSSSLRRKSFLLTTTTSGIVVVMLFIILFLTSSTWRLIRTVDHSITQSIIQDQHDVTFQYPSTPEAEARIRESTVVHHHQVGEDPPLRDKGRRPPTRALNANISSASSSAVPGDAITTGTTTSTQNLKGVRCKGTNTDDYDFVTTKNNITVDKEHKKQRRQQKHASIPFLPVLPNKPDILPSFTDEIKPWMMTPGNETAGQFLLDFAIIGNAKCGTSAMMYWLHGHEREIQIPRDEITVLSSSEQQCWDLVDILYHYFDPFHPKSIKGYKSPTDLSDERAVRLLRRCFPQTKLVVGLRHPVWMIQSFYNFRIQNGYDMPPLQTMHYRSIAKQYAVSASRAEYHAFLKNLGKTPMATTEELSLMPRYVRRDIQKRLEKYYRAGQLDNSNNNYHNHTVKGSNDNTDNNSNNINSDASVSPIQAVGVQQLPVLFPRAPNPVFLYDTAQLGDEENPSRLQRFSQDVSNFLGLTTSSRDVDGQFAPPLPRPIHFSPGRILNNRTHQEELDKRKIRICDDQYVEQRKQLCEIGHRVSTWILQFLLPENETTSSSSSDVYVSNPQHFRELIQSYRYDPCLPQSSIRSNGTAVG